MTSGPVVALELLAVDAIQQWRTLLGPTNAAKAKQEAPNSLRARFGTDNTKNACHGSDSPVSAARELQFFFGANTRARTSPVLRNTTLGIIKPHAVHSKLSGKILAAIQEQFQVVSLQSFVLDRANAETFLEVYKGVLPEYGDMLTEFTSGTLIALEIASPSGNAHQDFRDFVGPYGAWPCLALLCAHHPVTDPEIARHIRPGTLRARFGVNKTKNAVHCTDLADDAPLEVEFFFKLLQ